MTAPTLGLAWACVAALAIARMRPYPVTRATALLPEHRAARHFDSPAAPARRSAPGFALPSRRGLVIGGVAACAAAVLFPPAGLCVIAGTFLRPVFAKRRSAKIHAARVESDVADVVTLIGLAVSAGHNLVGGLAAASARGDGPVALALQSNLARVERGERLADALESLPNELGEAVRPMVAALVSCDRYGAPLVATLDRLAIDVRVASRQRAEAAARRLPIKLLFPLISCILPAFALLTVAPLIAGSLSGLRL
ncbi:MAG: tight adherence protein [Actinomycetota bacterium]|jgi:Flp pilus assembly protein TadB